MLRELVMLIKLFCVLQLKKIRSLLIAGAANYDELYTHLRLMELPFQDTIKDLRYVLEEFQYLQLCVREKRFTNICFVPDLWSSGRRALPWRIFLSS